MVRATLALLLIASFLVAAYYPWASNQVDTFESVEAVRQDIVNTLDLTGTLVNDRTVTITALLDGEITQINAREGDSVEQDTVLAELDNRAANALLAKARADLQYQRAYLSLANETHLRHQRLRANGSGSQQALDDSYLEKRRQEAAVKVAQAELNLRNLQIENASVRAPFDGVIIEQNTETGQWVEAGTRLFTLVADEGRVIEIQIDADDASRVAIGQPVTLSSAAWPDREWQSEITWLAPSITNTNEIRNAFAARIEVTSNAPPLRLSQQLDVLLELQRKNDVVTVPQLALQQAGPGEYFVWQVRGGKARKRIIKTGVFSADSVEVTNGLDAGERIVLPGNQPIQEGQDIALR